MTELAMKRGRMQKWREGKRERETEIDIYDGMKKSNKIKKVGLVGGGGGMVKWVEGCGRWRGHG